MTLRVAVFGLVLLAGASACGSSHSDAGKRPKVVSLYGDSLLFESRAVIEREATKRLPGARVEVHSNPGTAPCDWLPQVRKDLRRIKPDVVVLESAGNAWTSCMSDNDQRLRQIGTEPFFEKYEKDLTSFFNAADEAGARVLYLAAPPISQILVQKSVERIEAFVREQAKTRPQLRVVDTPREAVSDAGEFAKTLPCLPEEVAEKRCEPDGRIAVREPAGLHFCPTGYKSNKALWATCPTYSSGAERYGRAVVDVVAASAP